MLAPFLPLMRGIQAPTATLLLDEVTLPASFAAFDVAKIKSDYTGYCMTVQRASDNTTLAIGFTSSGGLDTAAIIAFAAGSDVYVKIWHDQSGNGRDLTCPSTNVANMWRIYSVAGGIEVFGTNGRPCLRATDASRGLMSAAFTSITTTAATGAVIGSLSSTATASISPRYLSLFGASNTDVSDTQGVALVARSGSSTPTSNIMLNRQSTARATATGAYDTLSLLVGNFSEPNYSSQVNGNGASGTATVGALASTKFAIGHTGNSYASVAGQRISAVILWNSSLTVNQLATVQNSYAAYYGIPTATTSGGSSGGSSSGGSSGGGTTSPPSSNELARPSYAGATLIAQDHFGITGGHNLANFGGPAGNYAWPQNTVHPPAGAFYGPQSSKVSIHPDGYLAGYFDKAAPTAPITVYCGRKVGTNTAAGECHPQWSGVHQVFRNGHYITWNGAGGAARRRGGVWRLKMQYPTKYRGMGHVPLLWPTTEKWSRDGEIDMFENYSGQSAWDKTDMNIHYGPISETRIRGSVGGIPVDMTKPHIYACAWHPGYDDAGTGAYIRGYIDDVQVYAWEWNKSYKDTSGVTRPGTAFIMHGATAVPMNLRLQVEAYGTSDSDYFGGHQTFKFFWFQHWSLP